MSGGLLLSYCLPGQLCLVGPTHVVTQYIEVVVYLPRVKLRVVESENPPTANNVSAYTTEAVRPIGCHLEIISKDICSARQLA
jgi:hypothetical protein